MKALVLAAGRGTRMRAADAGAALDDAQSAAAETGLKAMMPLHGRPFLDFVLHSLADAGFDDVALVVGSGHDSIREYYGALRTTRVHVSCLTQLEPRGTADAVLAGEAWAGELPFITLNSDNLYPVETLRALRDADGPAVPGFERDSLGLTLERVGAFALIEGDGGPAWRRHQGSRHPCLRRIIEKPGADAMRAAGPHAMVSMNVWRFDARIFDACRDVPVSARGELELPQAVGLAASRGVCFEVIPTRGAVLDLSSRGDVARVAARLAETEVRL